jgi:hypothetical protein
MTLKTLSCVFALAFSMTMIVSPISEAMKTSTGSPNCKIHYHKDTGTGKCVRD